MEVLNISKGEWKICFDGQIDCNGKKICSGLGFECYKEFNENAEAKDNALLIVEAGNVYNETGFTPRQLADQKAKLLEACKKSPSPDIIAEFAAFAEKCAFLKLSTFLRSNQHSAEQILKAIAESET